MSTNDEAFKKALAKRQANLSGLVSSNPVLTKPKQVVEKKHSYNFYVSDSEIMFLRRYAYTRSCMLGRNVTLKEAVTDAIESLRKHTAFELKELPEWKGGK